VKAVNVLIVGEKKGEEIILSQEKKGGEENGGGKKGKKKKGKTCQDHNGGEKKRLGGILFPGNLLWRVGKKWEGKRGVGKGEQSNGTNHTISPGERKGKK